MNDNDAIRRGIEWRKDPNNRNRYRILRNHGYWQVTRGDTIRFKAFNTLSEAMKFIAELENSKEVEWLTQQPR